MSQPQRKSRSPLVTAAGMLGFAVFLQVILLFPLIIFGMYLSERGDPFFSEYATGLFVVFWLFYSVTIWPSLLIVFAGEVLARHVSRRLRFVKFLQPSICVGIPLLGMHPFAGAVCVGTGFLHLYVVERLVGILEITRRPELEE